jgi:hypothetical protein
MGPCASCGKGMNSSKARVKYNSKMVGIQSTVSMINQGLVFHELAGKSQLSAHLGNPTRLRGAHNSLSPRSRKRQIASNNHLFKNPFPTLQPSTRRRQLSCPLTPPRSHRRAISIDSPSPPPITIAFADGGYHHAPTNDTLLTHAFAGDGCLRCYIDEWILSRIKTKILGPRRRHRFLMAGASPCPT